MYTVFLKPFAFITKFEDTFCYYFRKYCKKKATGPPSPPLPALWETLKYIFIFFKARSILPNIQTLVDIQSVFFYHVFLFNYSTSDCVQISIIRNACISFRNSIPQLTIIIIINKPPKEYAYFIFSAYI